MLLLPQQQQVMRHMLTKLGVGAVDICSSGAAALEMLQDGEQLPPAQRFNMVLSDVFMPDMSVSSNRNC
jgi:CheY-like chemotaxis protein